MFNNPSNDTNVPVAGKHLEDGMQNVKIRNFLEAKQTTSKIKRIDDNKLIMPMHVNREHYTTHEELYRAIINWWTITKNRTPLTIKRRIGYAKKMQTHPIYPINWFEFIPEQIINHLLYLQHTEYKQIGLQTNNPNYGIFQIHNYLKTIKTFADAYGEDISYWGYTPPSKPEALKKIVPRPQTVNQLMHHRYTTDPCVNAIIKTILTLGFHIGTRPEELIIQQIPDIYLEEGYLFIREPKKKYRERQIWVDPVVMNSYNISSLKNWINIWRPRIANSYSQEYLFIKPNGKPFKTTADLRGVLNQHCKPVWPYFKPKIMRDWSAIARLIRQMKETGHWNVGIVKDDLGHKSQDTTEAYVRFARDYMRNDNYDWLRAVLKFHPTSKRMKKLMKQENRPCQKTGIPATEVITKTSKTPLTDYVFSRWQCMLPPGSHNRFLLVKQSLNALIKKIVKTFVCFVSSFSFYFFNQKQCLGFFSHMTTCLFRIRHLLHPIQTIPYIASCKVSFFNKIKGVLSDLSSQLTDYKKPKERMENILLRSILSHSSQQKTRQCLSRRLIA